MYQTCSFCGGVEYNICSHLQMLAHFDWEQIGGDNTV